MLKKVVISIVLLINLGNSEDSEFSYGLGLGALYNGVGVNIASIEKEDLKYLSVGCIGFSYSSYNGLTSNCGLGLGYINTGIIGDSNQHGLGVHLAVHEDGENSKAEVSFGAGYTYFANPSKTGWNFGLTPMYTFGDRENDNKVALLFDLGYQF